MKFNYLIFLVSLPAKLLHIPTATAFLMYNQIENKDFSKSDFEIVNIYSY